MSSVLDEQASAFGFPVESWPADCRSTPTPSLRYWWSVPHLPRAPKGSAGTVSSPTDGFGEDSMTGKY